MKQVEKVSIGGYAFTMEGEAAAAVSAYLDKLSAYYKSSEVMEGIEERMAELLLEKTTADAVVPKSLVENIIGVLGSPETIEEEQPAEPAKPEASAEKRRKKLYRDLSRAKIAGVCSGFSSYFDVDVAFFRLGFLILLILGFIGGMHSHDIVLFSVPLIYILLWIAMPAARTAQQRWEQRGESGSAEDIRRSVERGKVGDALHDIGNSPAWSTIGRIFEVCIGLFLLVIAVSGLFSCAMGLFGWEWLGLGDAFQEFINEVSAEFPKLPGLVSMIWVQIIVGAVICLPFIGMLYASIMLLFKFRAPSWHPGLWIFVIWLIAIIAMVVLAAGCFFSTAAEI